jgi:phenylalanyl-tRNA synthetase beta chain
MKISYNWLKRYIYPAPSPEKCAELLTNTGLEVEGMEKVESIPGGLKGLVVGKVLTCVPHPNADRLRLTMVDTGIGEPLPIVCGAPNVASGQKVIVALPGAELHPSEGNPFVIKKSKIRGEASEGMICAEDEIGLGKSHEGIIVLPELAEVGMSAAQFFELEQDFVFEIGLTPNRTDAMSHYGVARDLRAALYEHNDYELKFPEPVFIHDTSRSMPVQVEVSDTSGLKRYSGICLKGIAVKDSPSWLQNALKSIGQRPVNNIVDITNFVMFELGQPLHAFDLAAVDGNKVIVGTCPEGTVFTTLDGVERKLHSNDLMICNAKEAMCIAGVFGGLKSGVTANTRDIFIESACFDSVRVRKTSRLHSLKTDSSFRFERGTDPEATVFALERAVQLIQEIAGGKAEGGVFDWYPEPPEWKAVQLKYTNLDRLVGEKIDREEVQQILKYLGFRIEVINASGLKLSVPPFKTDVSLEADVIEEILRIYGYNKIKIPAQFKASINSLARPDVWKIKNEISDKLSSLGFTEILNNSLSAESGLKLIPEADNHAVTLLNPLSNELNVLRRSMLNSICESLAYNLNRQQNNLAFYEWGKVYWHNNSGFHEEEMLSLALAGDLIPQNWHGKTAPSGFFLLKGILELLFQSQGIDYSEFSLKEIEHPGLSPAFEIEIQGKKAGIFGSLSDKTQKVYGIGKGIWFSEMEWNAIYKARSNFKSGIFEPPKFPAVRRDLALITEIDTRFEAIYKTAFKTENKLLKEVNLFDVYEGEKLPAGKKSYAVSFTLQDETKTLTDKQVEKVMEKLLSAFEKELGARLRS